jgi:hypothetical protein
MLKGGRPAALRARVSKPRRRHDLGNREAPSLKVPPCGDELGVAPDSRSQAEAELAGVGAKDLIRPWRRVVDLTKEKQPLDNPQLLQFATSEKTEVRPCTDNETIYQIHRRERNPSQHEMVNDMPVNNAEPKAGATAASKQVFKSQVQTPRAFRPVVRNSSRAVKNDSHAAVNSDWADDLVKDEVSLRKDLECACQSRCNR